MSGAEPSTSRRHGGSRTRENISNSSNGPFLVVKKKKSRDGHWHMSDDDTPVPKSDGHTTKKKRHQLPTLSGPGPSASRTTPHAEMSGDRTHKVSSKQRHASRPAPDSHQNLPTPLVRSALKVKKEPRGDHRRHASKDAAPSVASDGEIEPQHSYSGAIAAADFARLKKEVESLKKQVASSTKTIEKQVKTISDLNQHLSVKTKSHREQKSELDKLKTKSKKAQELISNIEASVQCQICLDTLSKPYALSPCGHVLCQGCLQEWFRSAPPGQEEMDVDEPLPLIYRQKSCPCCRTPVPTRPLPLYIVKALVSTLEKAKAPPGVSRPSPLPDTRDPWKDIFPHYDEIGDDDDSDDDFDEHSDLMDDDDEDGLEEYDDTSNDEYEGDWVVPQWEPPADRSEQLLNLEPYLDKLCRRGATFEMIETYEMEYSRAEGISACVDGLCVYLGWNITLAEDDEDGERFILWCLDDMDRRPERWRFGNGSATRLVRSDLVETYPSWDSDEWIGDDDDDDEQEDNEDEEEDDDDDESG
ncbi:hypothetical protein BV25DRAFT_1823557 [Artomyces pyxidatus]|uniref:Uncharacterized protein n=1 Tax=Artomyces pyxidatus TaxID=48021 RepID=A0ACB8T7E5_9AGAM|nr:hypothetical protein BV25DRAFT_1823557 [Artomyces pyxidatus]